MRIFPNARLRGAEAQPHRLHNGLGRARVRADAAGERRATFPASAKLRRAQACRVRARNTCSVSFTIQLLQCFFFLTNYMFNFLVIDFKSLVGSTLLACSRHEDSVLSTHYSPQPFSPQYLRKLKRKPEVWFATVNHCPQELVASLVLVNTRLFLTSSPRIPEEV